MHTGPCRAPTIIEIVMKGPIPTISIMLIAVAWVRDSPFSKAGVVELAKWMNYNAKYKIPGRMWDFSWNGSIATRNKVLNIFTDAKISRSVGYSDLATAESNI